MRNLNIYYPDLASKQVGNNLALRDEQQLEHLRVLRVGNREYTFTATDGAELKAELKLKQFTKDGALFEVLSKEEVGNGKGRFTLILPVIRPAKLEQAVVEVTQFSLYSEIIVYTPDHSRIGKELLSDNKFSRLEKLALGSLVQSQGFRLPRFRRVENLQAALEAWVQHSSDNKRLIVPDLATEESNSVERLKSIESIDTAVLIGPEGGFSDAERQDFEASDRTEVISVSLGDTILTTETAAVAVTALLNMSIK